MSQELGTMLTRIGSETKRRAKLLAAARGITLAELVRNAVEREIREHEMSETQPPSRGERSGT